MGSILRGGGGGTVGAVVDLAGYKVPTQLIWQQTINKEMGGMTDWAGPVTYAACFAWKLADFGRQQGKHIVEWKGYQYNPDGLKKLMQQLVKRWPSGPTSVGLEWAKDALEPGTPHYYYDHPEILVGMPSFRKWLLNKFLSGDIAGPVRIVKASMA